MNLLNTFLISASLAASAGAASAEQADAPGTVHRLSPAEAQAVQDAAAQRKSEDTALDDRHVPDGRIHGEIGFGIGTGGYNSIYGTTLVPLGEDGLAALSFERTNYGRRRYRF